VPQELDKAHPVYLCHCNRFQQQIARQKDHQPAFDYDTYVNESDYIDFGGFLPSNSAGVFPSTP